MSQPTFRLPQRRQVNTALPGPRSQELARRRACAVPPGVSSAAPVYAAEVDGAIVVDVDGNALIDLGSGIAVTGVGASNPAVAAAVSDQVRRFTHTCFMATPYEGYIAVAEYLNELTPGDHDKRTILLNSGAEAVENAVKVARYATGRSAIVVLDNAYHGRTNLTMALTAKAMPYKSGFGPFAPEVYRVPGSYPYRDGLSGAQAAARTIAKIESEVGADRVAAVLFEPIQGEGGFIVPDAGFLVALTDWAREHGVVSIADEIQAGLARTGAWFSCEHDGVVPDLVTSGKALADGLPLAAVTGRAELMDAVHPSGLGGTYGGNPVACAAAVATLDQMVELDLVGRARRIGERVLPRLQSLPHPAIGQVRGRGAMLALELVRPGTTEPAPEFARKVAADTLGHGVILLTCGTYGNVIRLLPPLVIGEELLVDGLSVLESALGALPRS
ncbi:4-aminobutyrate--2-oxoglutarate transaminase [Rhodococcus sp. D2-41]|uniref:(S)-3-amino-2-methylpropionate transaminase n=1 Tax=Speluncibacter jeojiensis TaxID=2710754 RepID=A0A9X4M2Z7_9ACTN|nr:4-aminobutyrate--2-oxoglutarate transaminase [Rhodococcus sp. D2-41]MDG3011264.1 4-aminobutyrate--2-oxoglutarate transaminase [Rhodococcus sp. D2-41]MDG3015884.1 4-aminobutyrate--2-oxoglutarate transaminase [Corynebacteriales bacterium D3-21]